MRHLGAVLLVNVLLNFCNAYKILAVFPVPDKSHFILGNGFVSSLLKAGHEITYITPFPMKNATSNLRQIDVTTNHQIYPGNLGNLTKHIHKEIDVEDVSSTLRLMLRIANATVMHENVQKLIQDPKEQFDLIIVEWLYVEIYSGFSSVFNCPYIWSSSMDLHPLVLSLIDEMPNTAYSPGQLYASVIPPYTFWQRVGELYNAVHVNILKWLISGYENNIYMEAFAAAAAKRGRTLTPLEEMRYNASLMFGNSHVSSGQAVRLPQNYVPIAGYHVEDELEPLTKKFKKLMDEAKHGVVYFSMGSILKSSSLPEKLKKGLLDMFGRMNITVIWKYEENLTVPYNNVHLVKWAQQQSILAHPNCTLFITHGCLLSTMEAIHYGVPIIGIPILADHYNNINKAVLNGFAKKVELNYDIPRTLKLAIEDIRLNPKYRERVKELSYIYHNRPVSPRKEVVHWVEHVIRTRGAPHLRSPALLVPWYQKMYLDLLLLLIILGFVLFFIILCYLYSKRKEDEDLMKKWI